MSDTAIFIDFDHTISDTDMFFHIDVRNAILNAGIIREIWDSTYMDILPRGYTLQKHVDALCAHSRISVSFPELWQTVESIVHHYPQYVFPDVKTFLARAKKHAIPVFLLSFGNPEWQKLKVRASGLEKTFHECLFTETEGKKSDRIVSKIGRFKKIIMIDNSPAELDAIKNCLPAVETYLITRVPYDQETYETENEEMRWLEARKHLVVSPTRGHIRCLSLDNVRF